MHENSGLRVFSDFHSSNDLSENSFYSINHFSILPASEEKQSTQLHFIYDRLPKDSFTILFDV